MPNRISRNVFLSERKFTASFLAATAIILAAQIQEAIGQAENPAGKAGADEPAFKLEGGVQHSEKLAPVEKEFRRGAKIGKDFVERRDPKNHWYQIPDWAAGTWTSTLSTRTYARDLRSNRQLELPESRSTNMRFSWGFQRDKQGHVWEFAKEPYTLTLSSPEHKVIKRVLKRDFLQSDDKQVVLKLLTDNVIVNKNTDKVIKTVQVENIQVCQPSASECMTCNASYKIFDEDGTAVESGKEVNTSKRIEPFKNIDEYEGKNMRELFNEFLKAEGKPELLNQ